jgi:hypothetical protein
VSFRDVLISAFNGVFDAREPEIREHILRLVVDSRIAASRRPE